MARWRTKGAVGLTAALSLGLLISTTSGFSQADDRLPDVVTCAQFLAAEPGSLPAGHTLLVPAATSCDLTDVVLPGDLVVQPGAELSLTSSTVAGAVTADAAHRLALTDVAIAGTVSSTAAGTVPGPVVEPVPVVDPAAPVQPTLALTRVDAEKTIALTGTEGGIVVAGTDLLGTLTVADSTGDLTVASAEQSAAALTAATGSTPGGVPADDPAGDPAGVPAADGAAAPVEPPPVRTVVGTDLELTRISGVIAVDGTTVTGQVRLQQNAGAAQFGADATVAGGVHEIRPEPSPAAPVLPVAPGTTGRPADPAPGSDEPAAPVESAAPATTTPLPNGDTDGEVAEEPSAELEDALGDDPTVATTPGTAGRPAAGSADRSSTPAYPGGSSSSGTSSGSTTTSPTTTPPPGDGSLPEGLTVEFASGSLVNLGSVRPTQGQFGASGSLSPVTLTDTRTGAPGWSVSAQLTDFIGGSTSIGAGHVGWTPKLLGTESAAELGPQVTPGGPPGEGLSVIRRLGSAGPGQGAGTTVLGADLHLQLDEPVDPGTYTATLVITVLS